ncbi:MAG TPA: heavy metal translocating P-type ATPase [Candidatus Saccharimonadia bacterium]|nr:heavy metal translocating P-type ATPase [Candidatus Saccharimonadia bacterium]
MSEFLKKYKLLSFVIVSSFVSLILYFWVSEHSIANWILGVSVILVVMPLLWDMLSTIRDGKYGIDILAATAMITSVALGQYWTGMIIALMLSGGEALEDYAEDKAKDELKSLLDNKPKLAHLIKDGKTLDINISEVRVGQTLNIFPGEVVPVDCKLISGTTNVNEAAITGESMPVYKSSSDTLLSGTINMDGSITVKVLKNEDDSQYQQIIKLVRAATNSESPFVRLADRYSIPFTIIAFMIAGGVWIISGHAIRFLEVIVVATPCPLLLAAPIALISGMSRSAKHGIIVKNGASLEKLAAIRTIAFDKTGTLTNGKPTLTKVEVFNKHKSSFVLACAAGLESNSNHVLAQAIVDATTHRKIAIPSAKQVREFAGNGLRGQIKGKDIIVGRLELMQSDNVRFPKNFKPEDHGMVSYVAINKELAGVIHFEDSIRNEASNLVTRLRKTGIKNFLIITGDNLNVAKKIGDKLGISNIAANCLPADKMSAIEKTSERPIAFVGDGVNDAPVLTLADVGIALGAKGSTAASESADVVIMLDDVSKVASSVEIAKRTLYIAKQSILVGIIISILLMILFASGRIRPIYGALLQEIVDVIVIFNALRAHGVWQEFRSKEKEAKL